MKQFVERKERSAPSEAEARLLAEEILLFFSEDEERLRRFVATTGADLSHARSGLRDAGFQGGLLDFLMADEDLLVAFAQATDRKPDRLAATIARLRGFGQDS